MKKPEHVYETYIRASAESLWEAITSAEFTRQYWHRMAVDSDWQPGATVRFRYEDGRVGCEGEVLECDPPRRLVYTWRFLFDDALAAERPSRVSFEITQLGDSCRLRLTHGDFDPDSKVFPMISDGWAEVISSLKSLLETGRPLAIAGNPASERGAA